MNDRRPTTPDDWLAQIHAYADEHFPDYPPLAVAQIVASYMTAQASWWATEFERQRSEAVRMERAASLNLRQQRAQAGKSAPRPKRRAAINKSVV